MCPDNMYNFASSQANFWVRNILSCSKDEFQGFLSQLCQESANANALCDKQEADQFSLKDIIAYICHTSTYICHKSDMPMSARTLKTLHHRQSML